ncbi:MAG: DNA-deoxyinosine glycosylase [Sedimenticolaceae bacterium]
MSRVYSFPPIADASAERLVLGSMPGKASLRVDQYYAHPRNAFWPIVGALFGVDPGLPYDERCARLIQQRLAVWDVLKTCTRHSSLDSDIEPASIVPNDFQGFFERHPTIRVVYFNGAMAERSFLRYVLPELPATLAALPRIRLPSTSPANASFSFERKLAAWRVLSR